MKKIRAEVPKSRLDELEWYVKYIRNLELDNLSIYEKTKLLNDLHQSTTQVLDERNKCFNQAVKEIIKSGLDRTITIELNNRVEELIITSIKLQRKLYIHKQVM